MEKLIADKPLLQQLKDSLFEEKKVEVHVLRLDKIHPSVSGNKFYKLKYTIEDFFRRECEYLVTFGGAYSNHIAATAAAGKFYEVKIIGIIRGNELHESSNPVLQFASSKDMRLIFVSREDYRMLKSNTNMAMDFISARIKIPVSGFYILPEGGNNELAGKGCREIVDAITKPFDVICCACGTGATLAGIVSALPDQCLALGFAVLKARKTIEENIKLSNHSKNNWIVNDDYHFGGYAKSNKALKDFFERFSSINNIPVEPVYTAKMFFGLYDLIQKNFFKEHQVIIAVHTGGVFVP